MRTGRGAAAAMDGGGSASPSEGRAEIYRLGQTCPREERKKDGEAHGKNIPLPLFLFSALASFIYMFFRNKFVLKHIFAALRNFRHW